MKQKVLKIWNVIKKTIEVILALLFIVFEEIIWENFVVPIKKILDKFVKEKLKTIITGLNKYILLTIFLLILVIAEGMGIAAGVLLVKGLVFLSIIVYALKIIVAGITFWLFGIAKEKLNEIKSFKIGYDYVIKAKNWIESRDIYINVKTRVRKIIIEIKSKIKSGDEFKRVYLKLKEIFKKTN